MKGIVLGGLLLGLMAAATPLFGQPADRPRLARVAIDDAPPGAAADLLDRTGAVAFPVAIRVTASELDAALDARLGALSRRPFQLWLSVPAPDTADAVEPWQLAIRRLLSRHGAALTIVEVLVDRQPSRVAAFAVQNVASEIGERRSSIRVAIGGAAMADPARRPDVFGAELAPYVDLLAVPGDRADEATDWLHRAHLQTGLALTPADGAPATPAFVVDETIGDLAAERTIRAWRVSDLPPQALRSLALLGPLLQHDITSLDAAGVQLSLTQEGRDVRTVVPHSLLFDPQTFSTFLVYRGAAGGTPLDISLEVPVEGTPAVVDLGTGARTAPSRYQRDAATSRVSVTLPMTAHTMLIAFNEGATPIADSSGVTAVRELTVGEVIARHQQQQRAQEALLKHYMAHARMGQHFRPTVADPGYDVVTENRYFSSTDGVEWEELSFAVNGSKWGNDRPAFPLLQPEKVLALPLVLRFDEGYRYHLAGKERVDGFDCYVVRFEPVREDSALYKGTVWIDTRTFARIRVRASQGGLTGPVVSNEEDQRFSVAATIENRPIFLFTSLIARQIVLVAGRNLLVEKNVEFSDFRVNDTEFDRDRDSARESRNIMLRETANGLRYYVLENGRRVVSERPTLDVKALAMGVTLDPSYNFPLPILGIDYIDFEFRRPDQQLAILFAGVLAAGNIQRSHLFSKNVDASVDFFAIGAPASDRIYVNGREDESERLLTWPLTTGFNLGWQATPFMKAVFQYQFRFDGFVPDTTTAESYTTPSSTVTNGVGGAWEYRRDGYSLTTNAAIFRRVSWREWGATPAETSPSYVKYSAGLSRDFYLGPFQKVHLNGGWFGGQDLDRFGKYQFGLFDDTRIHGVPSSGVRFAELAVARGAYSFNLFDQYRFDLFAEHAWGRDDAGMGDWQRIPAFGFAVNLRAPWNTILRADFGKSFLPPTYGDLGSMTLQIMLLKPLR